MNFKSIAIAASLVFAAGSAFAADIDLGGLASASATIAAADFLGFADTSLTTGDGVNNLTNTAVIVQDGVDASGFDAIAHIDQIGATASFAMIYQGPIIAASMAYIQQNATLNTVAVITQR